MKKQFILAIVVFFASLSVAFAQPLATPYSPPQSVSCVTDYLHPTAGVPYTYTLNTNASAGTWTWFATKNPAFITGGTLSSDSLLTSSGQLLEASGNYGTTGNTNSVSITWSDAILAGTSYQGNPAPGTPTFVVGYFASADATLCADNIKIYEINPVKAFVVDIYNLDPADLAATPVQTAVEQCVDEVQGATYSGGTITYDYGVNSLFFEFVAANFTGYWVPTFALTGLDGVQTATYEYTYAHPTTWGTTPPTWTAITSGTTQIQVDPSVTTTEAGVSVFIRVTIENNSFETLAQQSLTMTLDGQNSLGEWDVVNSDCSDPDAPDQNDTAVQNINPRPTLTNGGTNINPAQPEDVIPPTP